MTGSSSHKVARARQVELAARIVDDLHELLAPGGHEVSAIEEGDPRGFEVEVGPLRAVHAAFQEAGPGPAVVLTLEARTEPPEGVAVLDLLKRRVHGSGGEVLEAARELCRKRGIRFEPGPWRYCEACCSRKRTVPLWK